jgi:hypothetical protein
LARVYPTNFNEDTAKQALIEARGDIFIASQILSVTALRLNRAIQVSAVLQATLDATRATGKGVSEESVRKAVEERISIGRVVGLDSLIDLASMPIDANSAQNQVKLAAAARLAGDHEHGSTGGELAASFKELADLYQQHAPRVRLVRERLSVEVSGPAERVVNDDTPRG